MSNLDYLIRILSLKYLKVCEIGLQIVLIHSLKAYFHSDMYFVQSLKNNFLDRF